MAVGKLEYKTCTKCGKTLPETTEYFHRYKNRLYAWCKTCKNNYSRKRAQERKLQKGADPSMPSRVIKLKNIDSLKQKYPEGMGIKIITDRQKGYGTITRHYEHFMTVQTTKYPTSILYKDILIGAVKIK